MGLATRATAPNAIQRLRKRHKLRIADIAKAAGTYWPTAAGWDKRGFVPRTLDAQKLKKGLLKLHGITVELDDLVGRA